MQAVTLPLYDIVTYTGSRVWKSNEHASKAHASALIHNKWVPLQMVNSKYAYSYAYASSALFWNTVSVKITDSDKYCTQKLQCDNGLQSIWSSMLFGDSLV